MQISRNIVNGPKSNIRFWWESGLLSASRNHLITFCRHFVHYACLRLRSAIVHFIKNNCLYLVYCGWSAQTSPKRRCGKHKYRVTQKDVYPWKFQLWLWLKSYLFQITTTHYFIAYGTYVIQFSSSALQGAMQPRTVKHQNIVFILVSWRQKIRSVNQNVQPWAIQLRTCKNNFR